MEHEEQIEQSLWNQLPGKAGEDRAEILIELARQAILRSQGAEALALTEEANRVYQSMGALAPTTQVINTMMGISQSLQSIDCLTEAIATIDRVIELQQQEGYPFVVDSLRVKAAWLRESGNPAAAIESYLECVRINEIEGEHEFLGHDLYAIAHCYRKLENWTTALKHFEQARIHFKEVQMFDEVAWCDAYIADAFCELNQPELAVDLANRSLGFAGIRNTSPLKCISNLVLGRSLTILGDYEAAESSLVGAQVIITDSKEWEVIRRVEVALLDLYQASGNYSMVEVIQNRLKSFDSIIE